jgi:hypothetical protein
MSDFESTKKMELTRMGLVKNSFSKKIEENKRERDLIAQRDGEIISIFQTKRQDLFVKLIQEIVSLKSTPISNVYLKKFNSLNVHAIDLVVNAPASRFWVSPEQAAKIISTYNRSIPDNSSEKTQQRNQLIFSIWEKHEMRDAKSISELSVEIVEQPAPSFFIGKEKIRQIIFNKV